MAVSGARTQRQNVLNEAEALVVLHVRPPCDLSGAQRASRAPPVVVRPAGAGAGAQHHMERGEPRQDACGHQPAPKPMPTESSPSPLIAPPMVNVAFSLKAR